MGKLYDLRLKIEQIIDEKRLDPVKTKGEIGLKAGLMIAFVNQNTPDDAAKVQKLQAAAKEVLNVNI